MYGASAGQALDVTCIDGLGEAGDAGFGEPRERVSRGQHLAYMAARVFERGERAVPAVDDGPVACRPARRGAAASCSASLHLSVIARGAAAGQLLTAKAALSIYARNGTVRRKGLGSSAGSDPDFGRPGECPERQRGRTVNPLAYAFVGSSPTSPTTLRPRASHGAADRGCSSMVEQQPSKLMTRVRFPSPAPSLHPLQVCQNLRFGLPTRPLRSISAAR